MAAQWRLLTDYLLRAGARVSLTWAEFDAIVRGLPRSTVDHDPQWWHGDRPNTRAWRTAGYEAAQVDRGVAETFVRTGLPVVRRNDSPPHAQSHPASCFVSSRSTNVACGRRL
jgi:hypothetical protein